MAYKVVLKKNRRSILARGIYSLRYLQGETIEAPEGSLGIMCFENIIAARQFMTTKRMLIEVEGLDELECPPFVCVNPKKYYSRLKLFYEKKKYESPNIFGNTLIKPPRGTVCYRRVRVLS